MSTIHLHRTTTATPEQYVVGLTDFGPGRSKIFGNSADEYLKVHYKGASQADVTEGSALRKRRPGQIMKIGLSDGRSLAGSGSNNVMPNLEELCWKSNMTTTVSKDCCHLRLIELGPACRPSYAPPFAKG
ncbi:hypothetical protein [Bradyrhizobium lablabi]|uniref:hypothetical protein n=1 Tax=Bradyrhizobium lablabi TaxID=722472 RepID=UPI001BA8758C|nr:hypothetical protein [Bradyrhizobium lablabi]MBR0694717.1 hypothetical protein [Bradyrhizobium lablabi]